jgi:arabinose-5-phosphate isomerase
LSGAVQASHRPKSEPARDLESARRVFRLEAEGIQALMRALDGPLGAALSHAVDLIKAATGRVIVTGMGKSGHVARKIAATMASVGTPAQYVHPAEASHGDLGMITKHDAVLALSNSGETTELGDLVA